MTPTLSVLMANYNHAHFLEEALDGIFAQSFPPTEVILVDDASTDNSVEVIERYAARHPALRLFRNPANAGPLFTAQRALAESTGRYVISHSADDVVLPGFFESCITMLEAHPQAGLCCHVFAHFDAKTRQVHNAPPPWGPEARYFQPMELAAVLNGGFIPGHASIYRREALLEAGGYLTELRWHCDWFASLVIAARHGICYRPEHLSLLRVDPDSYSAAGRRVWEDQRQVLDFLLTQLNSVAYRDVVPFFAAGRILGFFGDEILRVVAEEEKHWTPITLTLLEPVVNEETRGALRKLVAHRMLNRGGRAPVPGRI